jgi:hypothetical protein
VPGRAGYVVEALGPDRTNLTSWIEMRPSGVARLVEPLMARTLTNDVEANLGTLKEVLEARS